MGLSVVVIGGGAAGFFGAIACAEAHPGTQVTLLERGSQFLAKVRISGGGRCNVTHACFDPKRLVQHYPRGGQALLGPFHRFQPRDTVDWFESRGVKLKTEPDNRMFPVTDKSQTIIDCLTSAAQAARVDCRTNAFIVSINKAVGSGFTLTLQDGAVITCDKLLLATGSNPQGHDWVRSLGHTLSPPVPSLFTFTIPDARLQGLSGLSVEKAVLTIPGTPLKQTGPLLITHWGLSGPAVLKLSAWGARILHDKDYKAELRVNWLNQTPDEIQTLLQETKLQNPKKTILAHFPFKLARRLWERFVQTVLVSSDQRWADLSKIQAARLTETLSSSAYQIQGKSPFKEEFVTCGGVPLDEVNFKTMESRLCPGLFLAGEILDIDGITGGFNFQSAWTTSHIAGQSMGETKKTA